jgi:hypothetical protein
MFEQLYKRFLIVNVRVAGIQEQTLDLAAVPFSGLRLERTQNLVTPCSVVATTQIHTESIPPAKLSPRTGPI